MWIIPTADMALVGILNSKMGWWLISKFCTQIQNGYQLIWQYLSKIPIPKKLPKDLTAIVGRILAAKKNDPQADTTELESKIDRLVYKLYGITDEKEIAMIEGRTMDEGTNVEKAKLRQDAAVPDSSRIATTPPRRRRNDDDEMLD